MDIQIATNNDLNEILEIFKYARKFMKENGNPNQWKDNRPSSTLIEEDIKHQQFYCIKQDDVIVGVFAFIIGDDITYHHIEGKWLNDAPYGVIHRIASNGKTKGILNAALNYCESHVSNIRIDTHEDNKIMQHLLEKRGYQKCGIIYVDDGTPRIAYQKEIQ